MPIPDFQSVILPLLTLASDRQTHQIGEVVQGLAQNFRLTEQERNELLPSGRVSKFRNRVEWARSYLRAAGLLQSAGRGVFRITDRGISILKEKPGRIDTKLLERYPEFVAFQGRPAEPTETATGETVSTQTPEELLESSYLAIRKSLAEELLQRVLGAPPVFFEKLVIDLLVAMGYGGSREDAGQAVGRPGDEGIDGIIKEDRLGLDVIYVQAKRWKETVGRPIVEGFAGSLEGHRARKGVFITTSDFTKQARDYTERIETKIVLIDGEQLASLMIDHGIGVTEERTFVVKKIDSDYFGDTE